jgi:DNA gyrase subunit A
MTTPPDDSVRTPVAEKERIEDVDLSDEMQGSFLEYAYSVIYSRALPDARDGLKPVQRRILYQMAEMGLRPDRGHVKSARVVGEVMGKLHPHGDASIYDAMVRLTQSFIMRLPLIDGHGNFGSLDDGPAASRYTEARLEAAALAMTEDLDEDVVDFVPNYDSQLTQPDVLPAAFPNLLVNGASGIAVGMATNMAPHNLVEVIGAARHLLEHPEASLADLMGFVPGPDLPTGGTIIGLAGVKEAYATGRGSFRTRAKVSIEPLTPRKQGLVVTELPYLVGPEKVIEKIKDGVGSKKLSGISDVTDLTDRRHGLRLVIGIKTGFSAAAVLEQLYRYTPLEDGFSINNVALVDGGPRTLGLRDLLQVYLDHRLTVVTRRSRFRLAEKQARLHLVEGLLVAILDIDEVIQVIRTSEDGEEARGRLIDVFDLSRLQAEYILELRLRRLTRFSRIELEAERDALRAEIAALEAILGDPGRIREVVSTELQGVADRFGTPRRTLLTEAQAAVTPSSRKASPALELSDDPCTVYLTTTGRALRVDLPEDGVAPVAVRRRSRHDAIRSRVTTTSRAEIGAVTNLGRLVRFSPVDLPNIPANSLQPAAGVRIVDYIALGDKKERVVGLVPLDSETPIALGTALGVVKRVAPGQWPPRPEFEVLALRPGDQVVGVAPAADAAELVFITADARLLRFPASSVRPQGPAAGGVAGIALSAGSRVLQFAVVDPGRDAEHEPVVVTVSGSSTALPGSEPGRAKVSVLSEFPPKGRGTGGVRAHGLLKGEDGLIAAWAGDAPPLAVAADGGIRVLPETRARRDASGVPLAQAVSSLGGSA